MKTHCSDLVPKQWKGHPGGTFILGGSSIVTVVAKPVETHYRLVKKCQFDGDYGEGC